MARKTGGLGKGISALIPDAEILVKNEDDSSSKPINNLKLSQVEPNPNQPRKTFDIEKLETSLGIPVVGVTARKKKTLKKLTDILDNDNDTVNEKKLKISYPEKVENAISIIEPTLKN